MKIVLNIMLLIITAISFLIFMSQAMKEYKDRDTHACVLSLISWVIAIGLNIAVQMFL